jgi:hypothetical protein
MVFSKSGMSGDEDGKSQFGVGVEAASKIFIVHFSPLTCANLFRANNKSSFRHQLRPSAFIDLKIHVVRQAVAAVHFLHVLRGQVHIFASHFERGVPQNLLQAEYVSTVDLETHAKRMPADVGM